MLCFKSTLDACANGRAVASRARDALLRGTRSMTTGKTAARVIPQHFLLHVTGDTVPAEERVN